MAEWIRSFRSLLCSIVAFITYATFLYLDMRDFGAMKRIDTPVFLIVNFQRLFVFALPSAVLCYLLKIPVRLGTKPVLCLFSLVMGFSFPFVCQGLIWNNWKSVQYSRQNYTEIRDSVAGGYQTEYKIATYIAGPLSEELFLTACILGNLNRVASPVSSISCIALFWWRYHNVGFGRKATRFILGGVFVGVLFLMTGSILPAFLFHMAENAAAQLPMFLWLNFKVWLKPWEFLTFKLLCCVLFVVSSWFFWRLARGNKEAPLYQSSERGGWKTNLFCVGLALLTQWFVERVVY